MGTRSLTKGRKKVSSDTYLKNPRYRSIMRLYISGMSVAEISRKTGASEGALWRMIKSPAWEQALQDFDKDAFRETDKLIQTAHRRAAVALVVSIKRLQQLAQSKNPDVAFAAFEKLLKVVARHGVTADGEADQQGSQAPVNILQVFSQNPQALSHAKNLLDAVRDPDGTYEVKDK